ncbi:hypothetical protein YC2023_062182 [Brassica napus]
MEKEVPEWFSSSLASLLVFDGKTKGVKSRDSPPPTLSSSSSSITHEGTVTKLAYTRFQTSVRRLHPDKDLYRDQEQHKVHVDVYEWKCGYCRKSFNEDKFLDQHFATRHFNLLNTNTSYDNSVMLIPVLEKNKPFPRGGKSMLMLVEEIGCLLPRCINTDLDATPTLLSAGLLTPKIFPKTPRSPFGPF